VAPRRNQTKAQEEVPATAPTHSSATIQGIIDGAAPSQGRATEPHKGTFWEHRVRGGEYEVLGIGRLQVPDAPAENQILNDMDELVVYRGADGELWFRRPAEFMDGRFEQVFPACPDVATLTPESFAELSEAQMHAIQQDLLTQNLVVKARMDAFKALMAGRWEADMRAKLGNQVSGTVSITQNGFTVKAVYEKEVEWDAAGLEKLANEMHEAGDDPTDYMDIKTTFGCSETKYKGLAPDVQHILDGYRATSTKPNPKITISSVKE
jgi:hypothetical protein